MGVLYVTKELHFMDSNNVNINSAINNIYKILYDRYDCDHLFEDEAGKSKGVKFAYSAIDNDIIKKMREMELDFLTVSLYRELRYRMTTSSEAFCVKKTNRLFRELAFEMNVDLNSVFSMYKDLFDGNFIIEIKNGDDIYLTCQNAILNFEKYFHKVIKDRESKRAKAKENAEEFSDLVPSVPVEFSDPFNLSNSEYLEG